MDEYQNDILIDTGLAQTPACRDIRNRPQEMPGQ
jgi:hypothetical protein